MRALVTMMGRKRRGRVIFTMMKIVVAIAVVYLWGVLLDVEFDDENKHKVKDKD